MTYSRLTLSYVYYVRYIPYEIDEEDKVQGAEHTTKCTTISGLLKRWNLERNCGLVVTKLARSLP